MAKYKAATVDHDLTNPGVLTFRFFSNPSDETGEQVETSVVTYDTNQITNPTFRAYGFGEGVKSMAQARYQNIDDRDAIPGAVASLMAELVDGTWSPRRIFSTAEPTDMELALCDFWGVTIDVLRDRIENTMKRDKSKPDGLYRDAKGRTHRLIDAAQLRAFEADPRIMPLLAKHAAERAKRLAAQARKGAPDAASAKPSLLDEFMPVAAAAQ